MLFCFTKLLHIINVNLIFLLYNAIEFRKGGIKYESTGTTIFRKNY